ncbi:MAG: DUF6114 domain-containing protein [Candidatus Thermoplasmatota archaeon]|jgi:hypothetical protein|nr:DUF6114 domain-containing protein [Candidatus Thermoplasmatota archaeon]
MYVQASPPPQPPNERPTGAFVLSLIGGIFIVLGGITLMSLGAFFAFFLIMFGVSVYVLGFIGVVVGVLVCISGYMVYRDPGAKVVWGALIIVFALLSWVVAFGGFFIGFLLALIGGILALTFKPVQPAFIVVGPPVYPPPPPYQ